MILKQKFLVPKIFGNPRFPNDSKGLKKMTTKIDHTDMTLDDKKLDEYARLVIKSKHTNLKASEIKRKFYLAGVIEFNDKRLETAAFEGGTDKFWVYIPAMLDFSSTAVTCIKKDKL
jgi:hypothetical protein